MRFKVKIYPMVKLSQTPFCIVTIFLLVTILSFSNISADELSSDLSPKTVELDPLVVSARRVEVPSSRVAEDLFVLSEEDIKKLPARNLGEALRYVPGVDVSVTNGFGQPTSVTIRGSRSRHVLIMVDGIPFNTQLSGTANPTRIPLEHLKRVEVIKGAASSAWGSSLGGVINVITKDVGDTARPKGKLTSSFAEFETHTNSMELAGKVGPVGYFASGTHFETEGSRPFSAALEDKLFGKLAYNVGEFAKVIGSFGYVGSDVNDKFVASSITLIEERPTFARYGNLQVKIDKPKLDLNAAVKYNNQEIKTITIFTDLDEILEVKSSNTYYGFSFNGSYVVGEEDLLVFGTDLAWHVFESTPLLEGTKSLRTQAPFASYTFHRGNWDIIPGIRYDRNQHFGSQTSPSMGVIYHIENFKNTQARFKFSRAFNAPPLLNIFNEAATIAPNPNLRAERGFVWETGLETGVIPKVVLDVSLFWAKVSDAIATVKIDVNKSQRQNLERVKRQGGEMTIKYQMLKDLHLTASGGFNHVVDLKTKKLVRGNGTARKHFRLAVDYQNEKGFGLYLQGYIKRWDSLPDEADDRKFIVDLTLTQDLKVIGSPLDVEIFLNIQNLTNSRYHSFSSFPLPKRYFEGGFTLNF